MDHIVTNRFYNCFCADVKKVGGKTDILVHKDFGILGGNLGVLIKFPITQ